MRKLTATMLPSPPRSRRMGWLFGGSESSSTIVVCQVILGLGAYLSGAMNSPG